MDPLKSVRAIWSAGDYGAWGDLFVDVSRKVVEIAGVAGLNVLDVATGTGNTALAAARAGGRVTALDAVPELLREGSRRAAEDDLSITWVEADMQELGFPDASFDRVFSTFGAMLATDAQGMAAELVRVCRPGGSVLLTAWRAEATFTLLGETVLGFLPPAPEPSPHSPLDWADPTQLRSFFEGLPAAVSCEERDVVVRWRSVDRAIEMIRVTCGPLRRAIATLEQEGRWPEVRDALERVLVSNSQGAGEAMTIEMPYLLTSARRVRDWVP